MRQRPFVQCCHHHRCNACVQELQDGGGKAPERLRMRGGETDRRQVRGIRRRRSWIKMMARRAAFPPTPADARNNPGRQLLEQMAPARRRHWRQPVPSPPSVAAEIANHVAASLLPCTAKAQRRGNHRTCGLSIDRPPQHWLTPVAPARALKQPQRLNQSRDFCSRWHQAMV